MPTTTSQPKPQKRISALAIVLAALSVFLLIAVGALWMATTPDSAPAIGGPFSLTAANGKHVTDRDFRGKYLLVYFGYTYCPDVCPTTLQEVARALDKLGAKSDELQPLFITVDPRRDTPDAMARYTAAFSPRLIGLTGSPEEIGNVEKEYRVYAEIHRTGPGPDDYSVDHSSILYLMGTDGRFIAPIAADEKGPELAADIERHLS